MLSGFLFGQHSVILMSYSIIFQLWCRKKWIYLFIYFIKYNLNTSFFINYCFLPTVAIPLQLSTASTYTCLFQNIHLKFWQDCQSNPRPVNGSYCVWLCCYHRHPGRNPTQPRAQAQLVQNMSCLSQHFSSNYSPLMHSVSSMIQFLELYLYWTSFST